MLAASYARNGWSDEQIANEFCVSRSTLCEWKKHPEFSDALQTSKSQADALVENALFKRALGQTTKEKVKVTTTNAAGEKTVRVEEREREIPGDVGAQKLWLNNRKPAEWRDKPTVDTNAELLTSLDNVIVSIQTAASNYDAEQNSTDN